MFAIPAILTLYTVIITRPHEINSSLKGVPVIYVLFTACFIGLAMDLRLRLSQPRSSPQVRIALIFYVWCIVATLLNVPSSALAIASSFAVQMILYMVVIHGVQSFRALERLMFAMVIVTIFIGIVGTKQARSPKECVRIGGGLSSEQGGEPEGRYCDAEDECYNDGEPGSDYLCERQGPFGTMSVGGGRVRYRGILQDPNEFATALGIGMPFAFALFARRRNLFRLLLAAATLGFGIYAIINTASRTGQLVAAAVIGMYFIARLGLKGAVIAALVTAPAMLLGGRSGAEASSSTEERLEAWAVSLQTFRSFPIWGAGAGQFGNYHYLTSHNSFLLVMAELGFVGLFLWNLIFYMGFKIAITGLRRYRDRPEAAAAYTYARGLIAGLSGLVVGTMFLSIAYHALTWTVFALTGCYYLAVRRHDPEFNVSITRRDLAGVLAFSFLFVVTIYVYVRAKGF